MYERANIFKYLQYVYDLYLIVLSIDQFNNFQSSIILLAIRNLSSCDICLPLYYSASHTCTCNYCPGSYRPYNRTRLTIVAYNASIKALTIILCVQPIAPWRSDYSNIVGQYCEIRQTYFNTCTCIIILIIRRADLNSANDNQTPINNEV